MIRRALCLAVAVLAAMQRSRAAAELITLENGSNFKVVLTTTGASIVKLLVPDCGKKPGQLDVALGFDDERAYAMDPHPSFGATVGRVANRISNAQFTLDGVTYKLFANEGNNSIHGGKVRWSQQYWKPTVAADKRSVQFTYTSKDGESGFPGTVKVTTTYSIPAVGSSVAINMTATTDKATPINIVNHNYFNLKGAGNGDILDTVVQIPSLFYTTSPPGDLVPTGQILRVKQNPVYSFTNPKKIRPGVPLANGGAHKGYDLNYVMPPSTDINSQEPVWWLPGQNPQVAPNQTTKPLTLAAIATEPSNGVQLRVFTNAPGIHLYSGNYLTGLPMDLPLPGKGGVQYRQYTGFCFEAQAFPNAVNTPGFPSSIVRPDEVWNNRVTYEFSCTKV